VFNEMVNRALHRDAFVHLRNAFSNIVRNFTPSAATSDGSEGRGASVVGVRSAALHTSLQARL
jgi:hypothetical protein